LWHGGCSYRGMTKKIAQSEDQALSDTVRGFAEQLLTDGVHPADLSYALTVMAGRLGLDLAPNAGVALAVVMKAASNVAMEWVDQCQTGADDVERAPVPLGTTIH